jgi:LEA14-like dessication related protein
MNRALSLALAAAALGCAHAPRPPPPPAPLPIERPLVSIEGAAFESFEFTGATLVLQARIDNANPFPLSLARVEYGIEVEGARAAQGSIAVPFAVPAAGSSAVRLPVRIRFAAVPGFVKLAATRRDAAYRIAGVAAFSTPAGVVDVPFAYADRMGIPQLPAFQARRAALRAASPTEVRMDVLLAVSNPNPFPIPPARIVYGLVLSGKEIVRAEGTLTEPIAGGATAELELPITVSVLRAGKAAARLLLPFASLDVALRGEASFGGVPVPLELGASLTR